MIARFKKGVASMIKRLCFLLIAVLLVSFAACSTPQSNTDAATAEPMTPLNARTYPSVVNASGVELQIGMSIDDLCGALQVEIAEDAFFVNPADGLRVAVHDGQICQIEINSAWSLKDEPGPGNTKDEIIAFHGEPQVDGEALFRDNQQQTPDHYLMSYVVEDGMVAYTYDTKEIVDQIAIRGVDSATFSQMIVEWQKGT